MLVRLRTTEMNKHQVIKYLKNKVYKLNQKLKDDYCDKVGTLNHIQTLENAILIIKGE